MGPGPRKLTEINQGQLGGSFGVRSEKTISRICQHKIIEYTMQKRFCVKINQNVVSFYNAATTEIVAKIISTLH